MKNKIFEGLTNESLTFIEMGKLKGGYELAAPPQTREPAGMQPASPATRDEVMQPAAPAHR